MKKIITVLMSLCFLLMSATLTDASDIDNHSMKKELTYLIQNNIMTAENGNYYPNRAITRAEFSSFIARTLKLEDKSLNIEFKDVAASYIYADDIAKAASAGIITGYEDQSFKPNNTITRQQMAVMLERALHFLEIETSTTTLTFQDTNKIFKEYRNAVAISTNLGIIKGTPEKDGVYFYPQNSATRAQAAAFIYRLVEVIAELKPDYGLEKPEVNTDEYELKKFENGKEMTIKKYETLDTALKDFQPQKGHYITYNGKIIKISYGIASTNNFTVIYGSDKKTGVTYVSAGTEMQYKNSDGTWVEVNIAGREGFVKLTDISLVPYDLLINRSYYMVSGSNLLHYVYNHVTKTYASYETGKAPAFLEKDKEYYSWDGVTFFNKASKIVGTSYNYYQFLPIHAMTNYTAEEIDNYILMKLQELETTGLSIYKEASSKSKLIGIGETLKKAEATYNVNALTILSLAIHESQYGMSTRAQLENNLFGLYVTDSDPLLKKFESIEANINELLTNFWKNNYIPPNASYANGSVLGNKKIGFNVKYASDPYWGAKVAGHYYRFEKAMGGKDAKNALKIGITTTTGLNVRTGPSTSSEKEFTYNLAHMPVIIAGEENGWYRVVSDKTGKANVYISKDYVDVIETIK